MRLVKAKCVKTCLNGCEILYSHCLGKLYDIDLDSKTSVMNHNTVERKSFAVTMVMEYENGLPSGWIVFDCLKVVNMQVGSLN